MTTNNNRIEVDPIVFDADLRQLVADHVTDPETAEALKRGISETIHDEAKRLEALETDPARIKLPSRY